VKWNKLANRNSPHKQAFEKLLPPKGRVLADFIMIKISTILADFVLIQAQHEYESPDRIAKKSTCCISFEVDH